MKILRVVSAILIVFAAVFTLFFGKNGISNNGLAVSPAEYRGILTLWQIDSFEGGVGSRRQFLSTVSQGFERRNQGVLVMAIDYTPENAEKALKEGKRPDLISFGAGVNAADLLPLTKSSFSGGVYKGETYALCWCRGGYCLIENPDFNAEKNSDAPVIVSQGEYTNPLVAFALSGKRESNLEILSPLKAYIKFTAGKSRYLIGTQRDIHRLTARGMDFTVKPLDGYNDLYQYIAVTSADGVKSAYAKSFAEYLVSEEVQSKLYKIGMLGCEYRVEYDSPEMDLMQKTEIKAVLSAFSQKGLIEELQARAIKAAAGDESELLKIKKLIATP